MLCPLFAASTKSQHERKRIRLRVIKLTLECQNQSHTQCPVRKQRADEDRYPQGKPLHINKSRTPLKLSRYKSRTPLKLSRETVAELKPASTASCTYTVRGE